MLTDAKIRGLKGEPGQRVEVADALVPGLRLRVTANAKIWVLRQRMGGKVRTVTLGPFGDGKSDLSLSKARTKAHDAQQALKGGAVPKSATTRASAAEGQFGATVDLFMQRHAEERVKRPEA